MKKHLFSVLAMLLMVGGVMGQVAITDNSKVNTSSIHVCDTGHTFSIRFATSSSITGVSLNIAMPNGMRYVSGSMTVVSAPGGYVINTPTGPVNSPVFTMSNLAASSVVELRYRVAAGCEIISDIVASNLPEQVATVSWSGGTVNNTSASYNINYGALNWLSGTTNCPYTGNVGSFFTRTLRITNSGNGVIAKFWADDKHGSGVRLDSVTLAPGIVLPLVHVGDSGAVYVDLASLTPSQRTTLVGIGTNTMDNDTMFESGEVLTINYYYRVLSCTNNQSDYIGHYGCYGMATNCSNSTDARQTCNVVINSGGPKVVARYIYSATDTNIYKMATRCGTGRNTAYWANTGSGGGAGFAKDFMPVISYNQSNVSAYILDLNGSLVDTVNIKYYNAQTLTGTSLPLSLVLFGGVYQTTAMGTTRSGYWRIAPNTLTSDPDGPGGLSDMDGDGFFDDLAVGDTFKMKWQISPYLGDSSVCPSSTPAYYSCINMGYANQCGIAQTIAAGDASSNLYQYVHQLNSTNLIVTGPADISDGQTIAYGIGIPSTYSSTNLHNVGQTYYTEYRLTLPSGFSITGTPTITGSSYFGATTTLSVASVTTVGSETVIRSQNNTNGMGTLNLNLTLACTPTTPSSASIPVTIRNVEEGAGGCIKVFKVGCQSLMITTHCNRPCPIGFKSLDGSADRVSFGFTNTSMTTRANASTPGVRVDRVMSGDTILVSSKGICENGTFNNAHFKIWYNDPYNGHVSLKHAGGVAKIHDASTGLSATVSIPVPTSGSIGTSQDTLNYNFSSFIGVTPAGLNNFSTGDSLNVNIYLVVDDANVAGTAYTVNNFRMMHYARETTTDTVCACDNYGDAYEMWTARMNSFYDGNNAETQGCGALTRYYYTYMERYWIFNDYFPGEFRPLAKVDTLTIDFGRNPIFLTPAPRITYMGDTSTGWSRSGTVFKFWRTGGWDPVFDNNPIGAATIKGSQSIGIPLKNTCEWQGTFNTSMVPSGVIYRGNQVVQMTNTNSSLLYTPISGRTIVKSNLNISPISTTFVGTTTPATWDVRICNQTALAAGLPWVAFELPTGVTAVSIEDVTSGSAVPMTMKTYGAGKVFAQFTTTLGGSACYTARLKANYNTCSNDSIRAITGFDCDTLTGNPDLSACTKWNTKLYLNPATTSFQINKITEPRAPQQLCADTVYNLEVVNINNATATNLRFQVILPAGITIVPGSTTALHVPQSGSYLSIPDPTFIGGGVYEYNISTAPNFASTLGANGMPGASSTPNNRFNIRFSVRTESSCTFVSGSQLRFRMTGQNPCGSAALPFTAISNLYIINGAPASTNSYGNTMTSALNIRPCETTTNTLRANVVNFGPSNTTTNEKIRITLPPNVTFVTGSYTSIRNALGAPTVTVVGGQQVLEWTMTAGVVVGDSFTFTYNVTPTTALTCGSVDMELRTVVSFNTTCITTGTTCNLATTTGVTSLTVPVEKPSMSITTFAGSSVPNGASGETVTISSLSVNNGGSNATSNYKVYIYHDANLNGVHDGGDFLLDSITVTAPHNAGATVNLTRTFNAPAGRACPLLAVIDSSACMCSKSQRVLTSVPFQNAGRDTTICSGQSTQLGVNPIIGYTYLWNPVTDLSSGSIANPALTGNNSGATAVTTQYILTTSRGTGCTSNDTVNATVNPIPQGLDIVVNNTCVLNNPLTFTASSTSTGVTYSWLVDGVAAGTGTSINRAMTGGSHTVQITATKGTCSVPYSEVFTLYDLNISATAALTTICSGQSTTLTASSTNATDYRWYRQGSSTLLGSTTTISTGTLTANTTFLVEATNGTCKDTAFVTVNVIGTSVVAVGDTTICAGQSAALSVPAGYSVITWSQIPSGTTIGTSNPQIVTPTVTTSYRVVAQTISPVCNAEDTVTVTVRAAPTTAIAGPDQRLCNTSTFTVTGNTPTVGVGTWSKLTGSGTIGSGNPATITSVATGLSGTYLWTINNSGCTSTDTVIVYNDVPVTANAGFDQQTCNVNVFTSAATNPSPYRGRWTAISGVPTITNDTLFNTGVFVPSGSPSGTATLRWTVTNGACQATDDVVYTVFAPVSPTANAGPDQRQCNNGNFTLGATTPTMGTGIWGKISGPGLINAPTSSPITSLTGVIGGGADSTRTVLIWTVSNGSCQSTDTVAFVNDAPVSPIPYGGIDQVQCNNGTFTVTGNTPVIGTGSWIIVSGTGTASGSPVGTISGVPAGSTTCVAWTIQNRSCIARDTVCLTNDRLPTAPYAGPDQRQCNNGNFTLAANTPIIGTGNWTKIVGAGTVAPTTVPGAGVTGVIATDRYVWNITNGSCILRDTVELINDGFPTTPNAGPDQNNCNNAVFTMAANTISAGTGAWFRVSGTGVATPPNSPTSIVTGVMGGSPSTSVTYVWRATNGTCILNDTVVLTNYNSVTTANAGPDQIKCNEATFITAANNPTIGVGTWALASGSGSIAPINSPTASATVLVNNSATYVWGVRNGVCSSFDTVVLTNNPLPIANAGSDRIVCATLLGEKVRLDASALGTGESGSWSVLSPSGSYTFTPGSTPNDSVGTLMPGSIYNLRWTVTKATCSAYDDMSITVNEAPLIIINTPIDTLCLGSTYTVTASVASTLPYTIVWKEGTPSGPIVSTSATLSVTPTMPVTHYYAVATIGACVTIKQVTLYTIGRPVANNDICISTFEDLVTSDRISTRIAANDDYSAVLRGGITYNVLSVKSGGNFILNTTADLFTYTPPMNFCGADTVIISITGNQCGTSDTSFLCFDVQCVNDAPVTENVDVITSENDPVSINVSSASSDPDGDPLQFGYGTPSVPGTTITVTGSGSIVVTPPAGYSGVITIPYYACDITTVAPQPLCDTSYITINVISDTSMLNNPPLANVDRVSTPTNEPVTVNARANDFDLEGPLTTPTVISGPSNGSYVVNPDGTITYSPNSGFNGYDTITYYVCDTSGLCDTSQIIVFVTGDATATPNQPPVASDDKTSTSDDNPVTINVKGNDSDPDGDVIGTPVVTDNPNNGSVVVNPDGTITYTPNEGFSGTDTFEYVICDNGTPAMCDTARVVITVNPENDKPIATDVTVTTVENEEVAVNVGAGCTDPDGDSLNYSYGTPSVAGTTVVVTGNGSIIVVPPAGYTGTITIPYIICDETSVDPQPLCDTAYITVNVVSKNDTIDHAPIANDDYVTTTPNTSVLVNVKSNDFDIENTLSNPTVVSGPANGTAVVNPDGTISYTPNTGFTGKDTITYVVCDSSGKCDTAIVVITVTGAATAIPNDAPIATDDYYTNKGGVITLYPKGNDSDPDGSVLSNPTIISGPSNGTATVNSDGTITYTPNPGYTGPDTIQYYICDDSGLCDTAYIFIRDNTDKNVIAANDNAQIDILNASNVTIPVLTNDRTPGVGHSITITTPPTNGTATLNADGTITYTPNAGFTGRDSFKYTLCDTLTNGQVVCRDAWVYIDVTTSTDDIEVPNAVTPNADGVNDTWDISKFLARFPNSTVEIFNRYGDKVWFSRGVYDNSWNGDNNQGGSLPDGTYYYIIDKHEGDAKPKAGFVTLNRGDK